MTEKSTGARSEDKRKTKKKSSGSIIASLLVGALIGFAAGLLAIRLESKSGGGMKASFVELFVMFLSFILLYFLHILIHEGGHLIFGLLSGYHFVSYRIGSFTLIRKNGKFEWKRFNIPGTGGQCLMDPPKPTEDGSYQNILYNLGGILMNFVTSLVAVVLVLQISMDWRVKILLSIFVLFGFAVAVMNGVPMKVSGIANDGYNVMSLKKDALANKAFYLQLHDNALLASGLRMKEIPKEEVCIPTEQLSENPLLLAAKINEYYWYADQLNMEGARNVLEEMQPYLEHSIPLIKNVVRMEQLFQELIGQNRSEVVDELYSSELAQYLKKAKYDINALRVLYTLSFFDENETEKKRLEQKLKKAEKNYPVEGEIKANLALVQYVHQLSE